MGIHSIPDPLPGQPLVSLICRSRAMKASGWCRIGGCSSCDIYLSGGPIAFILSCGSATLVQCSPSPVPRNLPEETSPNPFFLPLPSAPPIHRQIRQAGQQAACDRDLGSDTRMLGEPGKGPSSLCLLKSPLVVNDGNAMLRDLPRERESTGCKIPDGCLQVQVDPGLKQSIRDRQSNG